MVLTIDTDATHGLEQPFADSTLGIVIEGCNTTLSLRTLPRFPDGGGTIPRHKQPAGHFFILQQAICRFHIDVSQHIQDQWRGQEARAQPPTVVLQCLNQTLLRILRLFLIQQIKR